MSAGLSLLTSLCWLSGLCWLSACNRDPSAGIAESRDKSALTPNSEQAASPADVLHIPIGEFTIGSDPGETGREPEREPLSTRLRLGPFRIDSQLVSGPNGSPKLGTTAQEAEALCAAKAGRLCSEAEWERACRGPSSSSYPTGDKPCTAEGLCRGGFDTLQMTQWLEWTSSHFGKNNTSAGHTVVRGARHDTADDHRRCAARHDLSQGSDAKTSQGNVAFRCCYGAPNAAALKEPALGPAYEEVDLTVEQLRGLLKSDVKTSALASSAHFFKADAAATVLSRGTSDTKGFQLTTSPVVWRPGPGSEFLVVVGHDGHKTSFVLAYYNTRDLKKLAGSFIMKNEPGPVALAYAPSIRPRVHFSTCWGCPGETGKVLFREPEELVMLQP